MKYTHDILIKKYAFLNMLYICYVEVLVILMYGIIHLVCAQKFSEKLISTPLVRSRTSMIPIE